MHDLTKDMTPEGKALFEKGGEIIEVVDHLADLIPDENDRLQDVKQYMLNDAFQLQVKVSGAEAAELYDLKMEAAALIRKAANDLMVQNHALDIFDFELIEYFEIVRKLIEEYRLLFIRWVEKFDKWNYAVDRWGLFNPPGIGPFDKDPDDDIPFTNPFDEMDD